VSESRPPVPPGLRPVAGGAASSSPGGEEIAAVLREFGANRVALAAEVVRLRDLLQDALFEVSRRAADSGRLVTPPTPPPSSRPFGLPRRPGF
jgi:hypothetical protein